MPRHDETGALKVPCPVCKVEAGTPCRSKGQGEHYARIRLGKDARDKPAPIGKRGPQRTTRTVDHALAASYKAKGIAKRNRLRPAGTKPKQKQYPTQDPGHGKLLPPADAQVLFARLRALNLRNLTEYHATAHWIGLRSNWRHDPDCSNLCAVCGDGYHHLHHRSYARMGAESFHDIVPLCRICHEATHELLWARTPGVTLSNAHLVLMARRKSGESVKGF